MAKAKKGKVKKVIRNIQYYKCEHCELQLPEDKAICPGCGRNEAVAIYSVTETTSKTG